MYDFLDSDGVQAVLEAVKGKIPTVSNPNLLTNPNFSINQRGISGAFSDTGKYFVDRWRLVSGTVTVNSDGTLTLDGSICQPLENAAGANVTASVSAGTAVYDDTAKTFTITGNGDVISWAKLEIGCAATAFIPPDPATELLRCMRYYEVLMSANCDRGIPANLSPGNTGEAELLFKTAKRAVPSLVSNKLRFVVSSSIGYAVSIADIKQYTADNYGMSILTTDSLLSELPSYLFGVTIDTASTDALAVDAEIY